MANGKRFVLGVTAMLAVGAALRLLAPTQKSLWYDEAFSLAIVRTESLAGAIERCRATGHPPLYHVLIYPLSRSGAPVVAYRVMNVVLGLAAVALAFGVGRELRGPGLGLFVAGATALSPLAVHLSQEIRMYGLMMALGNGQLWLALRWVRRPGWRVGAALAVATALAALNHYYAIFISVGLGGFVLAEGWRRSRWRSLGPTLAVISLAFALFIPWLPQFQEHSRRNAIMESAAALEGWKPVSLFNGLVEYLLGPLPLGPLSIFWPARWGLRLAEQSVLLGLTLGLGVAGARALRRRHATGEESADAARACPLEPSLLIHGFIVPLTLTAIFTGLGGRVFVRYLILFLPLVLILLGRGAEGLRSRVVRAVAVHALIALTVPAALALATRDTRGPMREAAQWLAERLGPGDVALHSGAWSYLPFKAYLGEQAPQLLPRDPPPDPLVLAVADPDDLVADLGEVRASGLWLVVQEWSPERRSPVGEELHRRLLAQGWRHAEAPAGSFAVGIKWVELRKFIPPEGPTDGHGQTPTRSGD